MAGGSVKEVDVDSISRRRLSKTGLILISLSGGAAVTLSVICLPFVSPALRRFCLPYVPATATQIKNVMSALAGRSGRLIDLGSGDGRIVLTAAKAGFVADGVELNPWLVAYSKFQAFRLGFCSCARFYCQDLWKFNLKPYPNIVIFGVQEMDMGSKNYIYGMHPVEAFDSVRRNKLAQAMHEMRIPTKPINLTVMTLHETYAKVKIGNETGEKFRHYSGGLATTLFNVVLQTAIKEMPQLEMKLEKELCNDVHVVACRFPFPTWTPDATLGAGMDTVWVYKNPPRINVNSVGHLAS